MLNISISDLEYEKFGIKDRNLPFSEFLDIVSRALARQNLEKSVELAEKYHLSELSYDDIEREIKAARNEKGHN